MAIKIRWRAMTHILWVGLAAILLLTRATLAPADTIEQVRAYTRQIEFDYIRWTVNALHVKNAQFSLGAPRYLTEEQQRQTVKEYLEFVRRTLVTEYEIENIYADPAVSDPAQAAASRAENLRNLQTIQSHLGPLAETILQQQVSAVISDMGLAVGGQPLPPLLYHSTPLPLALIVSPRDVIRQDANISLLADLTIEQQVALEKKVESDMNVSALVVPVGGVGVYPTMVMRTTDVGWLSDTITHEWVHNFLTLRPLGMNYETSPELRTMNETTASIAGTEIGEEVLRRYYPEDAPPPPAPEVAEDTSQADAEVAPPDEPPPFNFQKEMHTTRVQADALLAAGKITEAEEYMEARRRFFWDNGYQIRRLNQAYFAFYGAYADVPGGAAGSDPVGPAVRALRQQSATLVDFINRISWMTSFEDLQQAVKGPPSSP